MKRLLIALGFIVSTAGIGLAQDLQDPFSFLQGNAVLAITQHGSVSFEYGSQGTKSVSLLDNVIEIGRLNNAYLVGLDAGLDGATAPQTGTTTIAWTAGAKLNLNALVGKFGQISPEWTFINSLTYGLRYSYESQLKRGRWTVVLGYSFGPATAR